MFLILGFREKEEAGREEGKKERETSTCSTYL